jgi:putative membrane protein
MRISDDTYRDVLAALFPLIWIALAIAPLYRHDWMLENLLVVIGAAFFLWWRSRSDCQAVDDAGFVFLVLHEIGAHYTYSSAVTTGPGRCSDR